MLKRFFSAMVTLIFFISTSQVAAQESAWQPEIKIGILSDVTQVNLQTSKDCVVVDPNTEKTLRKIPANVKFKVNFSKMNIDAIEIRGENIQLQDFRTFINGKEYYGGVRVNKNKTGLTVINLAPVEEYLRGVLPNEMSPSFHSEALKAQAVAARSFTLKNRNRHKNEGYDLCATTHCQQYAGVENFTTTDQAIDDTRGEILVFDEKIIDANFHTDSGGMTEDVSEVWGGSLPYLKATKELQQKTEPWTVKVTKKDFCIKTGINDFTAIKLSNLRIGKSAADRSSSGRVKFIQIVSKKKSVKVTGLDLRAKFGLPSTLFDIRLKGSDVIFEGFGRGHGVGMSQKGAQAYAQKDWKFDKILAHYYHGTKLKKLY